MIRRTIVNGIPKPIHVAKFTGSSLILWAAYSLKISITINKHNR